MYASCAIESDKKVFNKKFSCAEVYIYGSMNVVVKDSFTTNNFATHHLKNKNHQPLPGWWLFCLYIGWFYLATHL